MVPFGSLWLPSDSLGFFGSMPVSFGSMWFPSVPFGFLAVCLGSLWFSCGFLWFPVDFFPPTPPKDLPSGPSVNSKAPDSALPSASAPKASAPAACAAGAGPLRRLSWSGGGRGGGEVVGWGGRWEGGGREVGGGGVQLDIENTNLGRENSENNGDTLGGKEAKRHALSL